MSYILTARKKKNASFEEEMSEEIMKAVDRVVAKRNDSMRTTIKVKFENGAKMRTDVF